MRSPGRPRTVEPRACPNPEHVGSLVRGDGVRHARSGTWQEYRCQPPGEKRHRFSRRIGPGTPVPGWSEPPECPRHCDQAAIVRNGSYGRPGEAHRRQTYRCLPHDEAERRKYPKGVHFFTPPLPRSHVEPGEPACEACGEVRSPHHGDDVAGRRLTWTLPTVAEGLAKLAAGESYASVSRDAWASTGRDRTRAAKLSDAEVARRAAVAAWKRDQPKPKPTQPALVPPHGLGSPQPAATDYRRRRRLDSTGRPLPLRRTPSPSSALVENATG